MKEGLCEANPVMATNDPTEGMPARDRVLADSEIRAVWNACQDDDFGAIIKLLLLTGCRREEVGALKWSEVDLDTGVMTIPGTRTKNHRTLELTLPGSRSTYCGRSRVGARTTSLACAVGPSRRGAFDGEVERQDRRGRRQALAPWRLHDLRRTMRTN